MKFGTIGRTITSVFIFLSAACNQTAEREAFGGDSSANGRYYSDEEIMEVPLGISVAELESRFGLAQGLNEEPFFAVIYFGEEEVRYYFFLQDVFSISKDRFNSSDTVVVKSIVKFSGNEVGTVFRPRELQGLSVIVNAERTYLEPIEQ